MGCGGHVARTLGHTPTRAHMSWGVRWCTPCGPLVWAADPYPLSTWRCPFPRPARFLHSNQETYISLTQGVGSIQGPVVRGSVFSGRLLGGRWELDRAVGIRVLARGGSGSSVAREARRVAARAGAVDKEGENDASTKVKIQCHLPVRPVIS